MSTSVQRENTTVQVVFSHLQGCLANSDGANSDDRANSDDFLGKSLNFFPSYFLLFLGILTT